MELCSESISRALFLAKETPTAIVHGSVGADVKVHDDGKGGQSTKGSLCDSPFPVRSVDSQKLARRVVPERACHMIEPAPD